MACFAPRLFPENLTSVLLKHRITSNQNGLLCSTLSNQQAIKGIAMVPGELIQFKNMV